MGGKGNDVKIAVVGQQHPQGLAEKIAAHRNTVEQLVGCPSCQREHYKDLYDWQFIYCNDCGTYFEKHTGERIDCERPPKRYWHKDSETPNAVDQDFGALATNILDSVVRIVLFCVLIVLR